MRIAVQCAFAQSTVLVGNFHHCDVTHSVLLKLSVPAACDQGTHLDATQDSSPCPRSAYGENSVTLSGARPASSGSQVRHHMFVTHVFHHHCGAVEELVDGWMLT